MVKKKAKPKKKTRRSTSKKKTKKSGAKKKPFGGYAISFSGRDDTLEQVFGKVKVTPSEMTKKLWKFIKTKKLSSK